MGAARVISAFGKGRVDLDRTMDIQAHACLSSSHAVAALAADSGVMRNTGTVLLAASVAVEYGFTDIDGKSPAP